MESIQDSKRGIIVSEKYKIGKANGLLNQKLKVWVKIQSGEQSSSPQSLYHFFSTLNWLENNSFYLESSTKKDCSR